ncbi:hypothetical protein AWB74_08352 [Caballeronia arvi]|uniref:Uncharacterized protein n=1 Tax=Caballeronia arvi TaxID=1777135 RepID=A0A158L4V4_9BURK|nr:hypothetical protein AWB74_08352 [Caballeronia arvi]
MRIHSKRTVGYVKSGFTSVVGGTITESSLDSGLLTCNPRGGARSDAYSVQAYGDNERQAK